MSSQSDAIPGRTLSGEEVVRYSLNERLCHWLSGLSYVYCLISGLALYSPYLYWLAVLLGGGATARFWHPFAGLIFLVAAVWMHKIWRGDMSLTGQDKLWLKDVKYYVENQDEKVPPQERFNGGQKLFYWVMFYCAFLLLASGLVMWFPEYVPFRLSWIRSLAVITHEIVALITIGAFIIHVYMGVFMVPGGFSGMVRGHVSRTWALTHHRLWYEKIAGKPAAGK